MKSETRLYNGVPAVLVDDQWIVLSAGFDEIVTIPKNQMDDPKILQELKDSGFFSPAIQPKGTYQLTMITTNDCNLRCGYCFADSGSSVSVIAMPEEMAYAAVDHGVKASIGRKLAIAFFGGEPSMTGDLIKNVVVYAKKQKLAEKGGAGVDFRITTNGVMSASFLDFLVLNNFRITLSSDGPSDIQNIHRPLKKGGPSSKIVEETIRRLAAHGKDFKLRVTVPETSVERMADVVEWLHALGGNQIHFEPISIAGRASESTEGMIFNKPPNGLFVENLQKAILRGNELGVGIVNSAFMNIATPPPDFCEGNSDNRIAISYTGDITTCVEVQEKCHPASTDFIIGKYDAETKIIVLMDDRQSRSCHGTKVGACAECFAVKICGGGCPVRNFHTTGNINEVDPYRCENVQQMLPFLMKLFLKTSMEAANK